MDQLVKKEKNSSSPPPFGGGSFDPPPFGEDSNADSPPNLLVEYLASYVDSLEISDYDLTEILEESSSTIIFTEVSETAYIYLRKNTDLALKRVGSRGGGVLVLISIFEDEKARIRLNTSPEEVLIRTGALVIPHSVSINEITSIDYDFLIEDNDDNVIVAVSDSKYQGNGLVPRLDLGVSTSELSNWVSEGEEYILVDRKDKSIIDFSTHELDSRFESFKQAEAYHKQIQEIWSRRLSSERNLSLFLIITSLIGGSLLYFPDQSTVTILTAGICAIFVFSATVRIAQYTLFDIITSINGLR